MGGRGWKTAEIDAALATSPERERIHCLGLVPAPDLQALYAGAILFAYPSLYEGFGLPLLEAMAAGTPIMTSQVSSLPEVAGDAAVLVDATSVDAIRGALDQLLLNARLRAQLAERGRRREARFTWRRTAELTLASYQRAISERESRQPMRL